MQQRLEGHDQAIGKLQAEITELRLQHQSLLDNMGKMARRLDIAEEVEGNIVADSLALAEWDRSPMPHVVSVSLSEVAEKTDVAAAIVTVFNKAQILPTAAELVGSPQGKVWDLVFGGGIGVASTQAKRFLSAIRDNGKLLKVYLVGTPKHLPLRICMYIYIYLYIIHIYIIIAPKFQPAY